MAAVLFRALPLDRPGRMGKRRLSCSCRRSAGRFRGDTAARGCLGSRHDGQAARRVATPCPPDAVARARSPASRPPSANTGTRVPATASANPSQPERHRAGMRRRRRAPGPAPRSRDRALPHAQCPRACGTMPRPRMSPGRRGRLRQRRRSPMHARATEPRAHRRRSPFSSTRAPNRCASGTRRRANASRRAAGQSFSRSWTSRRPLASARSARARKAASPTSPAHVMP